MRRGRNGGFTLVELMITIAIIGVMASVASSGYSGYLRRARASEGAQGIGSISKLIKAYYRNGRSEQGIDADGGEGCLPGASPLFQMCPVVSGELGPDKFIQACSWNPIFQAIGFSRPQPSYFMYVASAHPIISTSGGRCDVPPMPNVFHAQAHSDLDGDGLRAVWRRQFSVNDNRELVGHQLYVMPPGPTPLGPAIIDSEF